jgi:hypothetical protein
LRAVQVVVMELIAQTYGQAVAEVLEDIEIRQELQALIRQQKLQFLQALE